MNLETQHKAARLAFNIGADLSRETLAKLAKLKGDETIAELADLLGIGQLAEYMAAGFLSGVFPGAADPARRAEYIEQFEPLARLLSAYIQAAPFSGMIKNLLRR